MWLWWWRRGGGGGGSEFAVCRDEGGVEGESAGTGVLAALVVAIEGAQLRSRVVSSDRSCRRSRRTTVIRRMWAPPEPS